MQKNKETQIKSQVQCDAITQDKNKNVPDEAKICLLSRTKAETSRNKKLVVIFFLFFF